MKISSHEKIPPAHQCSSGAGGRRHEGGEGLAIGDVARRARRGATRVGSTSWLTREASASRVPAMQRHRGLFVVIVLLAVAGFGSWYATKTWEGWEYILDIVGKGDNMPIAGLIPIIAFFTYLSMDEAFRHDRLIKQGREDEILDEMYK
jgi:hypothetical protein